MKLTEVVIAPAYNLTAEDFEGAIQIARTGEVLEVLQARDLEDGNVRLTVVRADPKNPEDAEPGEWQDA